MDIGTAKPPPKVLARVPDRLIDVCDPADAYSARPLPRDALVAMAEITALGRIPLLVGGTMLYFARCNRAFRRCRPAIRCCARIWWSVRPPWCRGDAPLGWGRWTGMRPRNHPKHPQRVKRALEVFLLTGQPMTELWGAVRALCVGH